MLEQQLEKLLKEEADVIALPQFETGTEGFANNTTCKVSAKSRVAIKKLLDFANSVSQDPSLNFTIYPVSTGNNWGYGSSLPSTIAGRIVLLDLAQLNQVTYFDAENGVVTIQPGVTQQQLYEFLQAENADFMVPVTGAGPNCSVLANALERGYGITPIADHFTAVTAINGYLPSGEFYTSSLDAMYRAGEEQIDDICAVDKTFKWKHGPYLDGLFTQSGNMIVTEITIVLARPKSGFDSFYMRFYDRDSFDSAYSVVKDVFKSLDGLVGSINLMDKRRVVSMVCENPNGAGSHQVMTDNQVETLAKQNDVPEWTIVGTLYGTPRVTRAARKDIRKIARKKADQLLFSSSPLIRIGKCVTALFNWSFLDGPRLQLEKLSAGIDIMKGKPNNIALPLAYCRNPRVNPHDEKELNPAKDGCGLLWYAPLVPANPKHMARFIDMVRDIAPRFNIEPMITFTNLSGYSTDSTIPIVFDLENPQAVSDAHACLETLVSEGIKKGFIPYRLNIQQQQQLDPKATFWKTAKAIATVLDKNQIVSPNRYNV